MSAPRVLRRPLRESEEKKAAMTLLEGVGAVVYHTSDNRKSHNTPGVADCLVFIPRTIGWFFFYEAKGEGGELSEDQERFQKLCRRCQVSHVSGGAEAVHEYLKRIGILA